MVKFCWFVTLLATVAATFTLFSTFVDSVSAPQQAAGAAISAAMVIIAYVFTRCIEGFATPRVIVVPEPSTAEAVKALQVVA
jgi:hypothetical protein